MQVLSLKMHFNYPGLEPLKVLTQESLINFMSQVNDLFQLLFFLT